MSYALVMSVLESRMAGPIVYQVDHSPARIASTEGMIGLFPDVGYELVILGRPSPHEFYTPIFS